MNLRRCMLVAAILLALPSFATAFPIQPQPLRQLCADSQLIVVAKVEQVVSFTDKDGYDLSKALLHISAMLKGDEHREFAEVLFSPNMICPAPPKYPEGGAVIAFLYREEGEQLYRTNGLSYGTKVVSENEAQIYIQRIREILEILKTDDSPDKEEQTIAWLVRCAEEPVTRWEGAYELFSSDKLTPAQQSKYSYGFAAKLTQQQKSRLSEALFRSTTISGDDLYLIDYLKDKEGERLVAFILKYMNTVVDNPPYYTDDLMEVISDKLKSKKAARLAKSFDKIYYNKEKENERKSILKDFISLIESGATT